jgi:hypothetical protein
MVSIIKNWALGGSGQYARVLGARLQPPEQQGSGGRALYDRFRAEITAVCQRGPVVIHSDSCWRGLPGLHTRRFWHSRRPLSRGP